MKTKAVLVCRPCLVMVVAIASCVASGDVAYTWPADTSGGLRFENNVYTIDTTPGTLVNNGTMTVTNATVNAWAQSNNTVVFENGSAGTVNLESNGVFKAYSFKPDGILNLNRGGVLELEKFTKPSNGAGCINADGGRIVFRNVSGPASYNWFENYDAYPKGWCVNVYAGGVAFSNAVNGTVYGYTPPIVSGVSHDGGVTYEGRGTIYANDGGHSFNGGTRLASSSIILAVSSDACFGAVPDVPTDNVFWLRSATLFGNASNLEIHRNRNIVVSPGVTMYGGSSSSLRILGTVRGDATTSILPDNSWNGALVLSPGAGRTNRVGRLQTNQRRLVIESGTTLLCADSMATKLAECLVGIHGDNTAYSEKKGVFDMMGGELVVDSGGQGYVVVRNYGQFRISGGIVDFKKEEVLNAFNAAGRTIVSGGELRGWTFRLSQSNAGELSVSNGGVLHFREFTISSDAIYSACRIDLNDGTFRAKQNVGDFLGKSSTSWPNVSAYVHEGGVTFDSNGCNIGVHLPLQSATARDGGLTKKGDGTLTMSKANVYNGPTRILGGTIAFTNASGFPGGDIEIDGEMLAERSTSSACVTVPSLSFNTGAKIRILVPSGFNLSRLKAWHKVVSSTATITGDAPDVEVVDAATREAVRCIAKATLDEGGKSISVKATDRGFCLIYR